MNVCSCHTGRTDQSNNPAGFCSSKKCSANMPIENIFINKPNMGKEYKITVRYHSGPKCGASSSSKFKL